MAATVQAVDSRARDVLNDPSKVRWLEPELLRWVSDALDLLARAMPTLFIKRGAHTCTLGALQTLTIDRVMAVVRVIGVPQCEKTTLDAFMPTWQDRTAGAAKNWMPSDNGAKSFYVYPPSPVGQALSVDYVEAPAELSAMANTLPVSDDYVSLLADYVIGMSESKDAEHVNSGRAAAFIQSFAAKLGIATK